MTVLNIGGIPTSLGEVINYKHHLDLVKNKYTQIRLGFYMPLLQMGLNTDAPDWPQKKKLWDKYLKDIGQLFFTEHPYHLENNPNSFCGDVNGLIKRIGIPLSKPYMPQLLARGNSLNIGEYIVITTKCRDVSRKTFLPRSIKMWKVLQKLSEKYKVVILGERLVEIRKEYKHSEVFGIYEQVMANIPKDRIVDLTVPALGETVADLKDIQQDCLIMKEAKFTISIGIGGNCCLSCASSDMAIGYRTDNNTAANTTYAIDTAHSVITKDWDHFIRTIERYL